MDFFLAWFGGGGGWVLELLLGVFSGGFLSGGVWGLGGGLGGVCGGVLGVGSGILVFLPADVPKLHFSGFFLRKE